MARFRFPIGAWDFSLLGSVQTALSFTQPPLQWVPRAASPVVKRSGHEADHSSPSSVEAKNGGAILPLPHASPWRGD
jgi:hypothetical protein